MTRSDFQCLLCCVKVMEWRALAGNAVCLEEAVSFEGAVSLEVELPISGQYDTASEQVSNMILP